MRRLVLLLALAGAFGGCGGSSTTEPAERPGTPPALVRALQDGGYVVYIRHTATDRSQEDTNKTDVSVCEGMRNLTERGREQARAIGRAFGELRIPVGDVLASEYCRTRETAELAFGRYRREPRLTGFPAESPRAPYEQRIRETKELLGGKPAAGTNTILVAHVRNLEATLDVEIDEGDALVFEPLGDGRFRRLGRLPVSAWPHLAEQLGDR